MKARGAGIGADTARAVNARRPGRPHEMKNRLWKAYAGVKRLPGLKSMLETDAWKNFRFKITLLTSRRENRHFTRFLRLPTQFEALSGPVLDFLSGGGDKAALKVAVIGCSTGAEAYSIAAVLKSRRPGMEFDIHAYDIDRVCIDKARTGCYTPEEVANNENSGPVKGAFDRFVSDTFEIADGRYTVREDIRRHVRFDVADVLNPELCRQAGASDMVFAQNFLFHLRRKEAAKGFKTICGLLKPRAALFIAGVDPDMLVSLTRRFDLVPCDYKALQIHEEIAMICRGWPYNYTGREPFVPSRKEWKRRYSTIFFRMTGETA